MCVRLKLTIATAPGSCCPSPSVMCSPSAAYLLKLTEEEGGGGGGETGGGG